MRYVVKSKTTSRTKSEINTLLKRAELDLKEGLKSGKYVEPCNTDHINHLSGENYNRMTSYIADLKRELSLPYKVVI